MTNLLPNRGKLIELLVSVLFLQNRLVLLWHCFNEVLSGRIGVADAKQDNTVGMDLVLSLVFLYAGGGPKSWFPLVRPKENENGRSFSSKVGLTSRS
jgi:hypothetical protein